MSRRRLFISRFPTLHTVLGVPAPPARAEIHEARHRLVPRGLGSVDLVIAESITVAQLRESMVQLQADHVPPVTEETNARSLSPLPAKVVAGFGPWYEARLPPEDMTALLGDPAFQAGEAAGEFRVAGKGVVMMRPPAQ